MSSGAFSARAMARVLAVCAVLAGLFFMHGLAVLECHGGVGTSASSMAHSAPVTAATGGVNQAAGIRAASVSRPLVHSLSAGGVSADAPPGTLCVSTPPSSGWAGLLALLLSAGVISLANAVTSPDTATRPRNQRLRAPPRTGSALLMNVCVSRM
ncbi:MAG TPA: DUF6153 family protein [Pseudonocardiaceae bacterium]|nr:DUF6153 family protein [Pseudonocardiaceae bacterium]